MWIKNFIYFFAVLFVFPVKVQGEPIIRDIPLPPVSFTRVTDTDLLSQLGLDATAAAWCYDDDANAILITAPARERAKCDLRLMYEMETQRVKYQFQIDKLNLRLETLKNQHTELNAIKDREIETLTSAALKRPNEYTVWWATGGFVAGVLTTIGILLAI